MKGDATEGLTRKFHQLHSEGACMVAWPGRSGMMAASRWLVWGCLYVLTGCNYILDNRERHLCSTCDASVQAEGDAGETDGLEPDTKSPGEVEPDADPVPHHPEEKPPTQDAGTDTDDAGWDAGTHLPEPLDAGQDAGLDTATDSGSRDAGEDRCDAGIDPQLIPARCPLGIVYVDASSGSDLNNGCSPCAPKASISSALEDLVDASAGSSAEGQSEELRVCKGIYDEPALTLDFPVSIHGGYECGTFALQSESLPQLDSFTTASLWEPLGADSVGAASATIVRNGTPELSGTTLTIVGTRIGPSVNVSGLVVVGGAGQTTSSVAIEVRDASPTLLRNIFWGGEADVASGLGSVGLVTSGTSKAQVAENDIRGGTGRTQSGGGSAGAWVRDSAAPHFKDNRLDGGVGTGTSWGSVGLRLDSTAALTSGSQNAIEGNTISGGLGSVGSGSGIASAGLDANGNGTVEIANNRINGGRSRSTTGSAIGLRLRSGYANRVAQNHIFGGYQPDNTAIGILCDGAHNTVFVNNAIDPGVGTSTNAIRILRTTRASVQLNTLYSGLSVSGVEDGTEGEVVSLRNGSVETELIGNLVLRSTTGPFVPVRTQSEGSTCIAHGPIARFESNAFVDFTGGAVAYARENNADCNLNPATLSQFEQDLVSLCSSDVAGACASMGGAKASNNLIFRAACDDNDDPNCREFAACDGTDESVCLEAVLERWSATELIALEDGGVELQTEEDVDSESVLFETGFRLDELTSPCELRELYPTGLSAVDLFGSPRLPPLSAGAHQVAACLDD